jgi:hypothetical protein
MSWITFEKKFGWAELFSAIAILISLGALWYARAQVTQNLPDLDIESQTAIHLTKADINDQSEWVEFLPFVVTNRGGRTVTLIKLERDVIPPVIRVRNGNATEDNELDISFALVEGPTDTKDFQSKALNTETRNLSMPHIINDSIESGKAKSYVMVLKIRDKKQRNLTGSTILFSCRAVFSDGTSHRIAQGIGYPSPT